MLKISPKYKESAFYCFIQRHKKYGPVLFFMAGFLWDSLTLGRIDRLYDIVILCTYMTLLTFSIYFFNVIDDDKWKNDFTNKYGAYLPFVIQFFFGGLSSAYVIYFSRSVSLSKTAIFFVLLVFLLFANEIFKKRISNKYLQFSAYFFVNFMFLSFFLPVILKEMNTFIFLLSGAISLSLTLLLIFLVFKSSKTSSEKIAKRKLMFLIFGVYVFINFSYYFSLIPPVPLALDKGIVAYNIEKENGIYKVTYEVDDWYVFWRDHKINFNKDKNQSVYIFTSIFAPTDLKKKIFHRWEWFNETLGEWEIVEDIGYKITGGRDSGFRGYTFKKNVKDGKWKVLVVTEEDLVIGVVNFNINISNDNINKESRLVVREF